MIIWPKRIQQAQNRWQDRHPKLFAFNPFAEWNKSPAAALMIRLAGFVPVCFALLAFLFASKNCSK